MQTLIRLAARLGQYEQHEARSIVRLMVEEMLGLTYTDICCGALSKLTPRQEEQLERCMKQLEEGVPVQYVIGKAWFGDRQFRVAPGVLIPRPETEELCQWIAEESIDGERILDIGTGSGCIAVTLALVCPRAAVTAWDISADALAIAGENAKQLGADVALRQVDVLGDDLSVEEERYSVIVSNPPYICDKEAQDMDSNVLDHEPHIALFVPDEDPLLFYRRIAELACDRLCEGGRLYFEINPIYADDTVRMLSEEGFRDIVVRKDQFGKQRMVRSIKQNVL